jgi:hypothetical protein
VCSSDLTTFDVKTIRELEPLRFAEPEEEALSNENGENGNDENFDNDQNEIFIQQNESVLPDEIVNNNSLNVEEGGQMKLF